VCCSSKVKQGPVITWGKCNPVLLNSRFKSGTELVIPQVSHGALQFMAYEEMRKLAVKARGVNSHSTPSGGSGSGERELVRNLGL
jgi:hypothetical protein